MRDGNDLDRREHETLGLRAQLGGTPTIGEIVEAGMARARAAVALFTPDEYAALRGELRLSGEGEAQHKRWQPRPNVLFEAGMAFGRDRVVFVVLGNVGTFSDIDGIHLLRPTNDPRGDRAPERSNPCPPPSAQSTVKNVLR